MTDSPPITRTVGELRRHIAGWRAAGHTVALVPTMGALHEGHLSLIDLACRKAARTVVSIFVNPAQFGENEDLDTYPRDEPRDLALIAAHKGDLVFAPDVAEMYPVDFATSVDVAALARSLCGASRPGHFSGVATVVTKLLNQVRADFAVFGEKDFQQLLVIRRLARDLDIETEILGAPIVREKDGLALSSRNRYLDKRERGLAPQIYKTIVTVAEQIRGGSSIGQASGWGARVLSQSGFKVEYLEVRNATTLDALKGRLAPGTPARVFAAARLGRTRLIDNVDVFAS